MTRVEETAGSRRKNGMLAAWLAQALAVAALLVVLMPLAPAAETAGFQLSGSERTSSITVTIGKSRDLRTGTPFNEVSVGDPEVADVNPLTDHSLSILGKKIGTTRVTVYGAGKKLVGIFDVEVTFDVTRLTNELRRRFPSSRIQAAPVNGRIMLTGQATDAVQLDQAVNIARQFGPDVINAVAVMSPQQVMLEVRFIEISREAGRELGFQWNRFGSGTIANIGNNTNRLPVQPTPSIADAVGAGVLSGSAPFGFLLSRFALGNASIDMMINALEQQGIARS